MLHSASRHLHLGGRDFTEHIMKHHTDRGHSFTFSAEREISLDLTEKLCVLSAGHDTELTSAVMDKEKTNELLDDIVGQLRNRLRPQKRRPRSQRRQAALNRSTTVSLDPRFCPGRCFRDAHATVHDPSAKVKGFDQ